MKVVSIFCAREICIENCWSLLPDVDVVGFIFYVWHGLLAFATMFAEIACVNLRSFPGHPCDKAFVGAAPLSGCHCSGESTAPILCKWGAREANACAILSAIIKIPVSMTLNNTRESNVCYIYFRDSRRLPAIAKLNLPFTKLCFIIIILGVRDDRRRPRINRIIESHPGYQRWPNFAEMYYETVWCMHRKAEHLITFEFI